MISRFSDSFKKNSKNTFIIESGKKHTYHETDLLTDQLAGLLKKLMNIRKDTLCALMWDKDEYSIYLTLAIWKCGAICAPVNPNLTEREKKVLIETLKPDFVLRSKEFNTFIPGAPEKGSAKFKSIISDAEDTAVVIFTSGTSSGKPKGVKLSYQNLISSFEALNKVLPHNNKDRWLGSLPFYHIGGFSMITRSILSGASIIIPDDLKTETLSDAIKKYKPTFASLVSTQFKRLLDAKTPPIKELRKVLLGGGAVDEELIKEGLKKKWNLAKVYGSSETSSLVTYLDCNKETKFPSAGKPLPGNIIEIREKKKTLPAGNTGEIVIKGNSVSGEYHNAKRETKSKFKDGYYHTGDYGYLDEEGYLFIEARRTDMIISGGEKINPSEVEDALKKIKGVKDASVYGQEDKEWGNVVTAAVILKESVRLTVEEIKSQLKELLASYKIPKKIYLVHSFPTTSLGKIKKQELKSSLS